MRQNDFDSETMVTPDEQRLMLAVCLAEYGIEKNEIITPYSDSERKLEAVVRQAARCLGISETEVVEIFEKYGV